MQTVQQSPVKCSTLVQLANVQEVRTEERVDDSNQVGITLGQYEGDAGGVICPVLVVERGVVGQPQPEELCLSFTEDQTVATLGTLHLGSDGHVVGSQVVHRTEEELVHVNVDTSVLFETQESTVGAGTLTMRVKVLHVLLY